MYDACICCNNIFELINQKLRNNPNIICPMCMQKGWIFSKEHGKSCLQNTVTGEKIYL